MRVFLTGASGYIGTEVARALRAHGHEVAGLVRPESESSSLRQMGVTLVAGDLASLPALAGDGALDGFDAFVHTAQSRTDTVSLDRAAVESFLGRDAYLLYTSGVWVLGNGTADESTEPRPLPLVAWRVEHEQLVLRDGKHGVLRPGCVYGGKQSLCAGWFAAAAQDGPASIVGDGNNRWAMVNLHDLAELYVTMVEQRSAGMYHGIDDTRATLNECAAAVAPKSTIEHVPAEAARTTMGPFTDALLVDQVIGSHATRQKLGWQPNRDFLGSVEEQRGEFGVVDR
jgi:nucleoside-diphosphate-sugar epimerase